MADFEADHVSDVRSARVSQDGRLIAELTVKQGIPMPGRGTNTSLDAYSHLDGVTRRTSWDMNPRGVRTRLGGAELTLGDHPIADELRSLGLPRRALATTTIPDLRMTFGTRRPSDPRTARRAGPANPDRLVCAGDLDACSSSILHFAQRITS